MRITASEANAERGKQTLNQRQSAVRSQNSQHCSEQREQKGVSKQLTNDPKAARSDRASYRQFMLPRCTPSQQQDRDISASDHEQQHHRAKDQVECSAHGADNPVIEAQHMNLEDVGKIVRHVFGELFARVAAMRHRPRGD